MILTQVFNFDYSVADSTYAAAKKQVESYKTRNPLDRFTKNEGYITEICATHLHQNGLQSDCRHLIGEFVIVGGKGWS